MKSLLAIVLCIFSFARSYARLGETPKQIYERYGRRVLWSYQVSGTAAIPDYCFLRDGYIPAYSFEPKTLVRRVGIIICYQTHEMDQIQVYYDLATTNSIAEIFYPKLPYNVQWDGISRINPRQQYESTVNSQHLEKTAMLIAPKAGNVSDFEPCPFHKRSYFSKTATNVVFSYGAGAFGVADLGHTTACSQEYLKRVGAVVEDLKKAAKY